MNGECAASGMSANAAPATSGNTPKPVTWKTSEVAATPFVVPVTPLQSPAVQPFAAPVREEPPAMQIVAQRPTPVSIAHVPDVSPPPIRADFISQVSAAFTVKLNGKERVLPALRSDPENAPVRWDFTQKKTAQPLACAVPNASRAACTPSTGTTRESSSFAPREDCAPVTESMSELRKPGGQSVTCCADAVKLPRNAACTPSTRYVVCSVLVAASATLLAPFSWLISMPILVLRMRSAIASTGAPRMAARTFAGLVKAGISAAPELRSRMMASAQADPSGETLK